MAKENLIGKTNLNKNRGEITNSVNTRSLTRRKGFRWRVEVEDDKRRGRNAVSSGGERKSLTQSKTTRSLRGKRAKNCKAPLFYMCHFFFFLLEFVFVLE